MFDEEKPVSIPPRDEITFPENCIFSEVYFLEAGKIAK